MSYWMEDYDSGEWYLAPFYDDILKRCVEIIEKKKVVRIGYVMLTEMKLNASKSDLITILSALEETGKYQSKLIKYKESSDFLVSKLPKKPLKERYWIITEIIKYLVAGSIGYAISQLAHK